MFSDLNAAYSAKEQEMLATNTNLIQIQKLYLQKNRQLEIREEQLLQANADLQNQLGIA